MICMWGEGSLLRRGESAAGLEGLVAAGRLIGLGNFLKLEISCRKGSIFQ